MYIHDSTNTIELVRDQYVGESFTQCQAGGIAQVAGIGSLLKVGYIVAASQLGWTAREQRSNDRMSVGVVRVYDLGEGGIEQVAQYDALAQVQIPVRIDMDTAWFTQVFIWAFCE